MSDEKIWIAIRMSLTAALLWLVYGETGLATTIVLALIAVNSEVYAAVLRSTNRSLDTITKIFEMILGSREK